MDFKELSSVEIAVNRGDYENWQLIDRCSRHPGDCFDPKTAFDVILNAGKMGKSIAEMAVDLGISKPRLNKWRETKPQFAEIFNMALTLAQAHWEAIAYQNINNKDFNTNLFKQQMAGRFRDDYGVVVVKQGGKPDTMVPSQLIAAIKQKLERMGIKTNNLDIA